MVINRWTPDTNCWEVNPHLITMKPFSELYETDEGGLLSSNYMWMVILMEENDEEINPQYALPEETRISNATDQFFPNFNEDFAMYKACRKEYPKQTMTYAQRAVYKHQKQIDTYQEFIDNTTLTLDEPDPDGKMRIIPGTTKQVVALSKSITGLFKELKELEILWDVEKTEAQLKGGRKLTASEKGLI